MKNICVFAGSSKGKKDSYLRIAQNLGKDIVKHNYSMVYGGGSLGLMGVVANSVLEQGGQVTGVITKQLNEAEVGHKGLTDLIVVSTMHQRKKLMAKLSEAIISLPGGVGTWEEFFEALAWNQLGIHSKPIVLLNVENYYSDLYRFAKKAVSDGFLPYDTFQDFYLVDNTSSALEIINNFTKKDLNTWFQRLSKN